MPIQRYDPTHKEEWNQFLQQAYHTSFLFNRDFMDYHADRFVDHSLMYYEKDVLVGILAANEVGQTLIVHQGLSYGSFILKENDEKLFKRFLEEVIGYLHQLHFQTLRYKALPFPFHGSKIDPFDVLEKGSAAIQSVQEDVTTLVDLHQPLSFANNKKKSIRRAQNVGLSIVEEASFTDFWEAILIPNLKERHGVSPTHSVTEIALIKANFSENILQFNVYEEEVLLAGATLFIHERIVHTQYLSANDRGKQIGALDLLISYFIETRFHEHDYLSFGISTYDQGRKLNEGLLFWKEGFGGKHHSLKIYEVNIGDYVKMHLS